MTSNSGDKRIKEQVDNMQVSFDNEAAWIRLQDRLESKDEKKPYFKIAWAAAAMLLIATVLWYSFTDTKNTPVVKAKPEVVVPVANEQPVQEHLEDVIVATDIQPIKKEKKRTTAVKKQPKPTEAIKEITPISEPLIVKEAPAPIPVPIKIVTAPKPKMKTVHINEVIEEEYYERRVRSSRYASGKNFLTQKQVPEISEYKSTPYNKTQALIDLNEEYRLIQN